MVVNRWIKETFLNIYIKKNKLAENVEKIKKLGVVFYYCSYSFKQNLIKMMDIFENMFPFEQSQYFL